MPKSHPPRDGCHINGRRRRDGLLSMCSKGIDHDNKGTAHQKKAQAKGPNLSTETKGTATRPKSRSARCGARCLSPVGSRACPRPLRPPIFPCARAVAYQHFGRGPLGVGGPTSGPAPDLANTPETGCTRAAVHWAPSLLRRRKSQKKWKTARGTYCRRPPQKHSF